MLSLKLFERAGQHRVYPSILFFAFLERPSGGIEVISITEEQFSMYDCDDMSFLEPHYGVFIPIHKVPALPIVRAV
jgi:hypothetical protein